MISAREAYDKFIHETGENDLYTITETNECYLFPGRIKVEKETGECIKMFFAEWQERIDGGDLQELCEPFIFDLFWQSFENDDSEANLVLHYAIAWDHAKAYEKLSDKYFSKDINVREILVNKWNEIEKELYKKLLSIIENEDIVYPPCCLAHMNDFYKLKPIMVRNGFTDDMYGEHWERIR